MEERKHKPSEAPTAPRPRGGFIMLGVFVCVVLVVGITGSVSAMAIDQFYADKIYPQISVAGIPLGNLTPAEAKKALQSKSDINTKQIIVAYGATTREIAPQAISLSPDVPSEALQPLYVIDIDATATEALHYGRGNVPIWRSIEQIRALFTPTALPLHYSLDRAATKAALQREFGALEVPATDAEIGLDATQTAFIIKPGKSGTALDYDTAVNQIELAIANLKTPRVSLAALSVEPAITSSELAPLIPLLEAHWATIPSITLKFENSSWNLDKSTLVSWLSVKDSSGSDQLSFDHDRVKDYLERIIAPTIEQPELASRFEIKDGAVIETQKSQAGRTLDIENAISLLDEQILRNYATEITLPVTDTTPTTPENPSDIAANELVAVGETNFKGSPKNRTKNIQVGASKINGLLIKPDEVFSLVKALGEIDGKAGFLPELVIKGDKTVPEYGGGLCQLGTTVFRAATYAGLPIVERRNHSYAVPYYNPIGFDATIYDPAPDFKFKNDTGNYLLIQTSVKGTVLRVELWGQKDARTVEVTKPRTFNIKKPGPTKIIEVDTLKPGEKKCTEKAHNGMDAQFERTVTYASGEKKEDVFKSHYMVWTAVCLVGKVPGETATLSSDGTPATTPAAPLESAQTAPNSTTPSATPVVTPNTAPTPNSAPSTDTGAPISAPVDLIIPAP